MIDDDYGFGLEDELPSGKDLREDYRLTARARAWILPESPEPESEPSTLDGVSGRLECQVRDISARGISLSCEASLSIGSILVAEVSLGEHAEHFRLSVEVMWCREAEWGNLIGVRVLESDETDYLDWIEAVARALSES
ncbi:PilZ domain-containing protein [Marinobacter nauticus]|jgi:PilZ domain.|uniref:PilZ domain-containing protein n=1 Tax=Marinobacter nauticus TaxID=2743 RepID=UPI001A8EEAA0|nr:PilZ domain-containing protein [Marinobacter nauticus]MBN8238160.1 PilZ domain-containing protein [Marinobacter nauticus]MCC4269763.1 PilZ domain-containing protein [Marinobacter nauticus]